LRSTTHAPRAVAKQAWFNGGHIVVIREKGYRVGWAAVASAI